jgi:hypothetical protein
MSATSVPCLEPTARRCAPAAAIRGVCVLCRFLRMLAGLSAAAAAIGISTKPAARSATVPPRMGDCALGSASTLMGKIGTSIRTRVYRWGIVAITVLAIQVILINQALNLAPRRGVPPFRTIASGWRRFRFMAPTRRTPSGPMPGRGWSMLWASRRSSLARIHHP